MKERYALAADWVRRAGYRLRETLSTETVIIPDSKTSHQDIVTAYDLAVEAEITEQILQSFPSDAIVGEETFSGQAVRANGVWYLDPIDGTTNFVNQRLDFAISLAYYEGGHGVFGVVLDVAADRMYHAYTGRGAYLENKPIHGCARLRVQDMLLTSPMVLETLAREHAYSAPLAALAQDVRAVRSMGCVALEICALAAGRFDLFATVRSCPWDHNAARVILAEAGGDLRALSGVPPHPDWAGGIIAAANAEALQRVFADYFDRKELN